MRCLDPLTEGCVQSIMERELPRSKPNVYILDKKGPVEGLFVRKPKSFGEPGLGVNPEKCRLLRHLMKKTLYI